MSFLDDLLGHSDVLPGAASEGNLGGMDVGQMQAAPTMSQQPGLLSGLTAPDPQTGQSKLGEAGAIMRDAPAQAPAAPQAQDADPTQLMLQHMRMARMAAMRAAMGGAGGGGMGGGRGGGYS